jgi:hypothetical protein
MKIKVIPPVIPVEYNSAFFFDYMLSEGLKKK